MPLPLDAYIDAWHGARVVEWIEAGDRAEPFFCSSGSLARTTLGTRRSRPWIDTPGWT